MFAWLEGRYPLDLREDIPTPQEMLDVQCEGRRYVTLMPRPEQQLTSYGRHEDACAFTLHDLEHAHKFFGDPECQRGQMRFFRGLRAALPRLQLWCEDAVFTRDLDYLMSDMNSHPVHLVKFLKAIILTAEIRRTGERHPPLRDFFAELFSHWQIGNDLALAALRINQPGEETVDDQVQLATFFTRSWGELAPNKLETSHV
jgi:hypothetical protein